jgi:hypothetical protein
MKVYRTKLAYFDYSKIKVFDKVKQLEVDVTPI